MADAQLKRRLGRMVHLKTFGELARPSFRMRKLFEFNMHKFLPFVAQDYLACAHSDW